MNLEDVNGPAMGSNAFRTLVEQAAIGIEQVSLDDKVLHVNRVLAGMLGYEQWELRGRLIADLTHPDHTVESTQLHRQLIEGAIPSYTVEKRYLRKDGQPIWVKVTASLARQANGAPAYRIAVVEDIDHRKLAEMHRQADEAKYRAIVDTAVDAIAVINESGIIQSFNPAAEKLFGYLADEVVEQNIRVLMPEPDRGAHDGYIANYRRTGQAKIIGIGREVTGQRKDGSLFPLELSIAEWRADGHRYFTGVMRDITDRKLAEARRQADEAKYRAIVDTAVDAIAVIDENGIIQSFNRSAEKLFGYLSNEVVEQNVRVLMPEPDRGAHDGYIANYRRTGQAKIIGIGREVTGQRKDGSLFPLELSIAEWRADGRRYFTGIMRDVTDRKRADEALHRLTETLERRVVERTAELEAANRRLTDQMEALNRAQTVLQQAQKMEAIGQLTGGIAHDFNNLLAVISGNLDLMIGRAANDPIQCRLINSTQGAAERGARLVEQLLAFARQQSLRPETVRLDELLREFAILVTRAVGAAIEVRFDAQAELWPVRVDTAQFQSAILNLAVNARDAMPGGGRLAIEMRNVVLDEKAVPVQQDMAPGRYVVAAVRDTGGGMTPEVAARAFDPFFTTKEIDKGTGLGLSQVYGFARQSGGGATIESELGRGTEVRIYLPQSEVAYAPTASVAEDLTPELDEQGTGRILVVDDDPDVLDMVVSTLEAMGYDTVASRSGSEALEAVRSDEKIDLLFTDVIMPGRLNGSELALEARRLRPDLRVLLTSGFVAVGADAPAVFDKTLPMLRKPYRQPDLARMLRDVLKS
jgi:PAS domain S-box-containing protein